MISFMISSLFFLCGTLTQTVLLFGYYISYICSILFLPPIFHLFIFLLFPLWFSLMCLLIILLIKIFLLLFNFQEQDTLDVISAYGSKAINHRLLLTFSLKNFQHMFFSFFLFVSLFRVNWFLSNVHWSLVVCLDCKLESQPLEQMGLWVSM